MRISGATKVAGVVGWPVAHSLSPVLHNAWIAAAGLDAVYVPFAIDPARFAGWVEGLRGGSVAGLNVTLPFKAQALAAADEATSRARAAEAANVLVFRVDGSILADNTDGLGMLGALAAQAPGFDSMAGPAVVLGAGGGARGAAAAFAHAGAPEVRIVNRTLARAEALAAAFGATAYPLDRIAEALAGANVVVNATSAGLTQGAAIAVPLEATPAAAIVMDMVYRPVETPLLAQARALGRRPVDGLEMLVRQAVPSFEAFYGQAPPEIDVRALALEHLESQ